LSENASAAPVILIRALPDDHEVPARIGGNRCSDLPLRRIRIDAELVTLGYAAAVISLTEDPKAAAILEIAVPDNDEVTARI
jgi:hypothetical protein